MSVGNWTDALPGRHYTAPFAAKKRTSPRVGTPPTVCHVAVPYRQWDGPIGPWTEHFGKGKQQVHSLDNSAPQRSCNEVEVVKLLRAPGCRAYWVSCYSPSQLPAIWQPFAIAPSVMPAWLQDIDSNVRKRIPHKTGGIPDVAAWMTSDPRGTVVFVEWKGPTEEFKENQEDWVVAALADGISVERFAVAVRTFL